MDLSEGDAELGTSQQGQVQTVLAVRRIHYDDLIEHTPEAKPVGRGFMQVKVQYLLPVLHNEW